MEKEIIGRLPRVILLVLLMIICIPGFSTASTFGSTGRMLRDIGITYYSIQRDVESGGGETQEAEAGIYLLNVDLQEVDRFKFSLSVGAGSLDLNYDELTYDDLIFTVCDKAGFSGGTGFACAGGVECRICEFSQYGFDITGRILYFRTGSEIRSLSSDPSNTELSKGTFSKKGKWLEYELGARLIYEGINKVRPYAGVNASRIEGSIDGEEIIGNLVDSESKSFDSSELFGAFLGIDFMLSDKIEAGCLVNLLSQTSYTVSLKYVF